jgi:hypothetical protein
VGRNRLTRAAKNERHAVVKWLRLQAARCRRFGRAFPDRYLADWNRADVLCLVADDIKNGDHRDG